MSNRVIRLVLLALSFALCSQIWAFADGAPFHWSGKLATDQTVAVKTINGQVDAEPATGSEVEISAQASGTHADEVKFEVKQNSDGVTVCEIYPNHDSCTGTSTGHHGEDHTRIEYKVRVPAENRFSARSVNGNISATNLERQVKASTVNGTVKVSTRSWAEAESVNGSVEAVMGSAEWNGDLRISSVNGTIRVGLPANANADVDVRTVNGSFSSEFPVQANEFMSHHVHGRVGNGGRELNLSSVNGSVHLVKSGS
jgi:DUF4097 and DUF4098 domain-containing protein YvlB